MSRLITRIWHLEDRRLDSTYGQTKFERLYEDYLTSGDTHPPYTLPHTHYTHITHTLTHTTHIYSHTVVIYVGTLNWSKMKKVEVTFLRLG